MAAELSAEEEQPWDVSSGSLQFPPYPRGAKPIFLEAFQPSCNFHRFIPHFPTLKKEGLLPGGGGLEEPLDSGSGGFVTTLLQQSGDGDDASTAKTSIVPNARPRTISLPVLPKQDLVLQLWVTGFVFGTWSDPCSAGIDHIHLGLGLGMMMRPSGAHQGGRVVAGIDAQLRNAWLPAATKQFLEEINKWTGQYNVSPLSWNVAVKFLMARKFDVLRAIELFHSYRETRLKEGIVKLKPHEEPLRSELLSGKFTILSVRDPSGASIALFTAKLHHPSKSVQHVVLQALFYLLDRAVESFETQRNGLVFIYDMAGSQYTNFELDLSKKILNLLKGAFPARLKKVFIVGAPMWFRVPYSIISLLLKEKLRERVQMVKMSELKEHLPRECLPEYLGGSLKLDPLSWNCRFLPQQNGHPDPLDELILVPLAAPKDNGSVHVPGPRSVTLQELLDHVSHKQKRGIYEEYEDIRRRSPAGTFVCSLAPYNQDKNRYGDVPCLDQTRVKLAKPYSRPELTDYINASFMDGYKQRNAYIGTQGPLENTYGDFWRMVWEQNVLVIVMTTRLEEGGRRKCGQYWPLEKDFQVCFGALTITNLGVENLSHYKKTILEIHSSETRERRLVSHFQYLSWPDYGVPSSATTLIDFLGAVKQQQRVAVSALGPRFKGHPGGPPVVVHCSAGIGRTGTFCALDICLSQLQDVGTLNIYQTVLRMRTQRAFSIQTPEQYYFCYTAILEHAQREGLLLANHSRPAQDKSSPGH
ncbi:hypothetical protein Nmel_013423 [Mimus melanotis]